MKHRIRVEHIDGPAYLANALVNDDTSGLDGDGKRALRDFLNYYIGEHGAVVATDGEEFIGRFDGMQMMLTIYVVHYMEDTP